MAKNSEVLGFLRVQFARIENKIERLAGDLIEIKQRVTALEIQLGSFAATEQTHYGTAMQRFDRLASIGSNAGWISPTRQRNFLLTRSSGSRP